METITAQKLRVILRCAGFVSAKKEKDRISWHWSSGYRVISAREYASRVPNHAFLDYFYIVHKTEFGWHILTQQQQNEVMTIISQYLDALRKEGVVCERIGRDIIVKGWRPNNRMNLTLKGRGERPRRKSSSVAAPLQGKLF